MRTSLFSAFAFAIVALFSQSGFAELYSASVNQSYTNGGTLRVYALLGWNGTNCDRSIDHVVVTASSNSSATAQLVVDGSLNGQILAIGAGGVQEYWLYPQAGYNRVCDEVATLQVSLQGALNVESVGIYLSDN